MLDVYEERLAAGSIGFEEWVATEYDAAELEASFTKKRSRLLPWVGRS
jgi:hypothetical protein